MKNLFLIAVAGAVLGLTPTKSDAMNRPLNITVFNPSAGDPYLSPGPQLTPQQPGVLIPVPPQDTRLEPVEEGVDTAVQGK